MPAARVRILVVLLAVVVLVGIVVAVTRGDGDSDVSARSSTTSSTRATTTASTTSSTSTSTTTTTTAPSTTAPTTAPPSTTAPADPFASVRIRLTRIASVAEPTAMAVRPNDGSLWIAQKSGAICRLTGSGCEGIQQVATVSTGSEQGLLGIAFSPSGNRFYASYTDPAGDTRLDELVVSASGGFDLNSRRIVFQEDQPQSNHNGGNIAFGPDGRLYLGLGDGGGAGDRHGSIGNGQDPGTDLGKILRIDPATNQVERWILGVRNPWRFSFDRATGDLWVADVGQGSWEEVTFLPAGAQQGRNLGWRCFEGSHTFGGCTPAGGHTGPIFEYSHAEGCSITGGYVYRGTRIPGLAGAYLFADYCEGEVRGLTRQGSSVRTQRRLDVHAGSVLSFGQDAAGELYVLSGSAVHRIDPG